MVPVARCFHPAFRLALAAAAMGAALGTGPAMAQGVCDSGRKLFEERQQIISQINGWGKKKVDPNVACQTFTKLQGNGTAVLKFMGENASWCRIPPDAVAAIETQQKQVTNSRAQACKVAADYQKAIRQAEEAKRANQNNVFAAPDDVTGGPRRIPSGAL